MLGSLDAVFDAVKATDYLAAVRGDCRSTPTPPSPTPVGCSAFAQPRCLPRAWVLGPWIHVSSDVALLGAVGDGETLDVRGEVVAEYERSGHRFVELDVAVTAGDRVVQRVAHTAIHTPRRLTHSTA